MKLDTENLILLASALLLAYFLFKNNSGHTENYVCIPFTKDYKPCKIRVCRASTEVINVCTKLANDLKEDGEFDLLVADPTDPEGAVFQFIESDYNKWIDECKTRKCSENFRFVDATGQAACDKILSGTATQQEKNNCEKYMWN
jgi:hypothetical protein